MPDYRYEVQELLRLDEDGGADCTRIIAFTSTAGITAEILLPELEEYLPDTARDFVISDDFGTLAGNFHVEDGFNHKLLRIPVRAKQVSAGGTFAVTVQYQRSVFAHADRGYLNFSLSYASTNISNYSLRVVAPSAIQETRIHRLEPKLEGDDPDPIDDGPTELVFASRPVSMNRRFKLEVSLEVIGKVEIPNLIVLEWVTEQIKNGTWFPEDWKG